MAKYFLIESRSPYESTEVNNNYLLAKDLANAGNDTTLFLIENGVFATRASAQINELKNLTNVNILADDFSLKERAISESELESNITVASIKNIVSAMADGEKTIWL